MESDKRLDIGFAIFDSFFTICIIIIGILTTFKNIIFGPVILGFGCIMIYAAYEAWSFVKE